MPKRKTDTVRKSLLRRVLEAGIHAPTAGNLQPVSIVKVVRPETKKKLAELNGGQACVADAAVDLVVCIDWHRLARWAQLWEFSRRNQ